MKVLENKNVFMLSVSFFNYENLIKEEMVAMGAEVDLYDERPSNSFYSKAIIRLKRSFYQVNIDKHYKNIIEKIKSKRYDFFLQIKGEVVPAFFLEFLRKENPKIVFIYYTYDSFKNNPNGLSILSYFDRKFTFDREDAIKYNLSFRPLFYASEYTTVNQQEGNTYKYDLSFIGTAHSDRYSISQKLNDWCKKYNLKMFNFYFSPSETLFKFKKLTDKNFKNFDEQKISFKSLSHKQIVEIYKDSKAILDINHPGQNGLTMRTFETLGAGRKLVTTNADIKSYPFYNENNIYIIDRQNPELVKQFFEKEFEEIENTVYFSMSLKGWIKELFEIESNIWKK
ncbi:hypothetical protein [Flavobacterium sp. GNP002]